MSVDSPDDEFQKELLELFSVEAQEWLEQARCALAELEHLPDTAASSKHLEVIHRGMTNLGGSAATVELPDIEEAAYAILPLLDTLRNQSAGPSPTQCATLRERLNTITGAIGQIGAAGTAVPPGDSIHPLDESTELTMSPPTPETRRSPLDALLHLQESFGQNAHPHRNVVGLVIEKVKAERLDEQDPLTVSVITRFLRELEGVDEEFLALVQKQMPDITEAVSALKRTHPEGPVVHGSLEPILGVLRNLEEKAQHVHAMPPREFFGGLHSFLTVVTTRGVSLVMGRLDAVEFRLGAVIPMVQQWVEMGRTEREAIVDLLSS